MSVGEISPKLPTWEKGIGMRVFLSMKCMRVRTQQRSLRAMHRKYSMLDMDLRARQFHIVLLKFINISKMTLNTVLRIQSNVK